MNSPELRFPFQRTFEVNPPDDCARLRAEQPVVQVTMPSGDRAWLATTLADVRRVYLDPRFSRTRTLADEAPRFTSAQMAPMASITMMDPPDHTRLRRLVAPAFTKRRIGALRSRIQQITDELLDAITAGQPPVDLLSRLAQPLPIRVLCEVLGVPFADHDRVRKWAEAALHITEDGMPALRAARQSVEGYLAELITVKRRKPSDDVLSTLIASRYEEDRLSEDELVDLGISLLLAGYDTTANQIANSVLALLLFPDEKERLQSNPALIDTAVEELLRHVPLTLMGFLRVAVEDVELSGVTIRAGEAVIPLISSANRDEEAFAAADRLDLTRTTNPHIAFGMGAHFCVGAQLARLELNVAISSLLARLPAIKLAVSADELRWKELGITSLVELPVYW